MPIIFTHLSPKDNIKVDKVESARNNFVITFGQYSKVFLTEEHIASLKKEIEKHRE